MITTMLRSQRILLMVGSVVLAWVLHANLCEWVFKERLPYWLQQSRYYNNTIWTWEHEDSQAGQTHPRLGVTGGASRSAYTGLVTDTNVDVADAVVFGIALPLALLLVVLYVGLGWRREVRRMRGLCVKCGYDLSGQSAVEKRCPECGTKSNACSR